MLTSKSFRLDTISVFFPNFLCVEFWKFPEVSPLLYSNRPNPNERRELKCSFIYTKDNLKVRRVC